ncbi:MAG: hypothetical protein GXP49_11975 [Deltaproteobacteria bacterium]|nr:hypothetical protein [Deltaproteobacteria bacterium]
MKRRRAFYNAGMLMLILASYFFLLGRKGACDKDKIDTLKSPVQAVCTVMEGSDGVVHADLTLISTLNGSSRFITTATNVQLEVPGGTRLTLAQGADGHYTLDSKAEARLVYEPGGNYLFKFELNDEDFAGDYAGDYFVGEVTAPGSKPESLTAAQSTPGPDHTCTIKWSPAFDYGIYTVRDDTGTITDSNWDFSKPEFDGSKWASLLKRSPAEHTISGQAFKQSGKYTISYAGCKATGGFNVEMSPKLGVGSGFIICSEISTGLVVP